ncbi:MAG: pentose kinase, partial [Verrucomicrobiia bacterium]
SKLWRQIFADAWKMTLLKTNIGQEAGSLGAAAVAAVGAGLWKDFSPIDAIHKLEDKSTPVSQHAALYEKLLPVFRDACHCQSKLGDLLAQLPQTQ